MKVQIKAMVKKFLPIFFCAVFAASSLVTTPVSANEPGWTHGVVLFGEAREKKDATPILQREYRPLHFYGNTVRRKHYRGTPVPSIGDGLRAAKVVVTRS